MKLRLMIAIFIYLGIHTSGSSNTAAESRYQFMTDANIIVVGDIEGDFEQLALILKNAGLVNESLDWSGANAHLVSTGDVIGHSGESRKVMDLFMKLQQQSSKAGGKVHVLLGDHEVAALIGDWRHTSKEEFLEFAADESQEMRERYLQPYIASNQIKDVNQVREKFDIDYPPGFFARLNIFMPNEVYGEWLRNLPFVIKLNEHLFTHGGLASITSEYSLDGLNQQLSEELRVYTSAWYSYINKHATAFTLDFNTRFTLIDDAKNTNSQSSASTQLEAFSERLLFSIRSPTHYTGNAVCHPLFEAQVLQEALDTFNASHLWVGHTTNVAGRQRFNGRLIMMDTGISAKHDVAQPIYASISKLSNEKNQPKWLLLNARSGEEVFARAIPSRITLNPDGISDEILEQILKTGNVVDKQTLGEGVTNPMKVTLSHEGKTYHAIFKYYDTGNSHRVLRRESSDRYQYEVAAYKLDRIMGLNTTPVAIERTISGKEGVLQLWIDDLINYNQMMEDDIEYEGVCHYQRQRQMLEVFDFLIHNADRNRGNIGFTRDDWQLWFYDHTRAFRTSDSRSDIGKDADLRLTLEFREVLNALSDDDINTLGRWLTRRQLRGIKLRRDLLLNGEA